MQSLVITLAWVEIAALVVGASMAIASNSGSDAAGRALATGYLVIGVTALLIFFVVPALLLAKSGHVVWLAATLSGIAAIPALVLAIAGAIGVAGSLRRKLRPR